MFGSIVAAPVLSHHPLLFCRFSLVCQPMFAPDTVSSEKSTLCNPGVSSFAWPHFHRQLVAVAPTEKPAASAATNEATRRVKLSKIVLKMLNARKSTRGRVVLKVWNARKSTRGILCRTTMATIRWTEIMGLALWIDLVSYVDS